MLNIIFYFVDTKFRHDFELNLKFSAFRKNFPQKMSKKNENKQRKSVFSKQNNSANNGNCRP